MATADLKRELILDGALELFAERTFAGSPVPLIAERAGVGLGTIYRYFDSKEALVNELYRKWKATMAADVIGERPTDPSIRSEFVALWTGLARFASAHPLAFVFLEAQHHDAYLDQQSKQEGLVLEDHALRFIRRAQRANEVRSGPPRVLLALAMGSFRGLVRDCTVTASTVSLSCDATWALLRRDPRGNTAEPL